MPFRNPLKSIGKSILQIRTPPKAIIPELVRISDVNKLLEILYGYLIIRTDNNEHPEIIITRNDECTGIRTGRRGSYAASKERELGKDKSEGEGGGGTIFIYSRSCSFSLSHLLPLNLLLRLGLGFPEVFPGVAGEDST